MRICDWSSDLCSSDLLSGTVILPSTKAQANGLEDLRLFKFTHDDGSDEWLGTYTAYSGREIQSELLRTRDFRSFQLVPMTGPAARNKGMALFPRKIGGQYMVVGRQDGQNVFLLKSDRLGHWEEGEKLLEPRSEEHTSELQSLMRTSYAVSCLKKKKY